MLVSGSCQSSREEGINNFKRCKVGGNAINESSLHAKITFLRYRN